MFKRFISALSIMFLFSIILSSCAPSMQSVALEMKTFEYQIPPQIKLEGVKTIAVLASRTDRAQILQAQLMEGLQDLDINIIDTQTLAGITREKGVKLKTSDLNKFGDKVNVDLFLVAEFLGPDTTALKIIEKDGRVSLARFIEGESDEEVVTNIVRIFNGYIEIFDDEIGYSFSAEDADKENILALHEAGKYKEVEDILRRKLIPTEPPLSKRDEAVGHINIAKLYEAQGRFEDSLSEYEEAAEINKELNAFTGQLTVNALLRGKSLVESIMKAENESKADSGSLSAYKKGAPDIAVLEFDTKAISDISAGWLAATFISTRLAQSNYNVYDRDYFRSIIKTEATLSEKELGGLLGVDKLVYGKFLKKTQVRSKEFTKTVMVADYRTIQGKTVRVGDIPVEKFDYAQVSYGFEIQGRVVDVKSAYSKLKTIRKEPITIQYGRRNDVPEHHSVVSEWNTILYDQLVAWIETKL